MDELANVADTAATAVPAIPEQLAAWLTPLLILLVVVAALWAVLALLAWFKRRAYNLTVMERAGSQRVTPDFLKVDHAAREAAMERGDAYARERAGAPAVDDGPEPLPTEPEALKKISLYARMAGIGSVLVAVANLVVAAVGALTEAQETHEFFYQMSSWERWQTLVETYWIGILVAALVIIIKLVFVIKTLTRRQA